jgi:hypothetical protein
MSTTKHTPTPWSKSRIASHAPQFSIYGDDDARDLAVVGYVENAEANAEFIVKAVNHHDELVAALELALAIATRYCSHDDKLGGIYNKKKLLVARALLYKVAL